MNQANGSLASQAYAALKRDIIRCEIPPGELILEAWLAERYGMSKTPIRQAIGRLETDGLVSVVPRKGTFVKAVSDADVRDNFNLRLLLEPEAAAIASKRATGEDIIRLEELANLTMHGLEDPREKHEVNRIFHTAIAEAAHVRLLEVMVGTLHEENERYLNYKMFVGQKSEKITNHLNIVELIKNGSEEEIRENVASGITKARQWILDAMTEELRGGY